MTNASLSANLEPDTVGRARHRAVTGESNVTAVAALVEPIAVITRFPADQPASLLYTPVRPAWLASMPPVGTYLYTEKQLSEAILADRSTRTPHQSTQRYMDELDAALVGETWLEARMARARSRAYSSDLGPQAPRIKWCALFDSHDRLLSAYLLTRDELNWTQLTLVDAAADHAPSLKNPPPELALLAELVGAYRRGELQITGACAQRYEEMLARAAALLNSHPS